MSDASLADDASPNAALNRTRRLAGAVLALMSVVFVASYFAPDTVLVHLIRSMAEAGMIGGLADWFAVEALFRHPLRIPIPHTALLPRNQTRAAKNVGRFFQTHFLEPASLRQRLLDLRPGSYAIDWVRQPDNALLIARELTGLLDHLLRQDPSPRTMARMRRWLRAQARRAEADPVIADGLARMIKEGIRSTALGEVLGLVRRAIDQNRDVAETLVQRQSRWWIATAVDRRLAGLVVEGVLSLLEELQDDRSELRGDLEGAFSVLIDQLAADGTLTRAVGEGRDVLVRTGTLDAIAFGLAELLRDRLLATIADEDDALAGPVADTIREFADRAASDQEVRDALDARVADLASGLIGDLRPAIADYVADVIAGWEPSELNERFESEIGPDLQYIRINGAVLGSLIGGLLFFVDMLLT